MNKATTSLGRSLVLLTISSIISLMLPDQASATSQWSRKTGMSCQSCHTVFPRLNSFGEEFLRNGYQMMTAHKKATEVDTSRTEENGNDQSEVYLDKVDHLFGFRLNMTPIQLETNSFQEDSASEKKPRLTLGNPIWLQMFVAGSIYRDISFFSELEHTQGAFKFNWFYFNFTNLVGSKALNFQVGNISPLEFASYPNRLPQLPNIKGEVFLIRSSDGQGEESVDMSSARPGIQYFGHGEWILGYAGISPGTKAVDVNQFLNYWGGLVFKMPEDVLNGFEGSTATIHLYAGTDTKNTGIESPGPQKAQVQNKFIRISPQVNVRYDEKLDIQAAYVWGKDENRSLVTNPIGDFKYHGFAFEGGYMPSDVWHLALHYDKYSSDNQLPTGKPVIDFQRIVPAVTYIINQNIRISAYYEKDMSDIPSDQKVDKIYINLRTMF